VLLVDAVASVTVHAKSVGQISKILSLIICFLRWSLRLAFANERAENVTAGAGAHGVIADKTSENFNCVHLVCKERDRITLRTFFPSASTVALPAICDQLFLDHLQDKEITRFGEGFQINDIQNSFQSPWNEF